MNIQLHIERLVIDGLPLNRAQSGVLQAALERELSHRLSEGLLNPKLLSGRHAPHIQGGTIAINDLAPTRLGEQIATAVHDGIKSQKTGAQR